MRRAVVGTGPANLRSLSPDRAAGGFGGLPYGRNRRAGPRGGDRRERGKPEPELVGVGMVAVGAVGEQVALAFLDAVLHVAAGAVEKLLVEQATVGLGTLRAR